ncbi:MAG: DegT/DnrJ/EryC1/StrS family aminotransferase [Acidimicrobiales bacterium]
MIPITVVRTDDETERLVLEVVRSGQLAQGAQVEQLESAFAAIHGVRHAIAVSNGTVALVAAMEALGVGPGDEVITTPFTFVATLNAILEAGATARFADIGPDFNLDPAHLGPLLGDRTRALLPVHLYGTMTDLGPLVEVAAERGLHLIEDAAQAVGAEADGRFAGATGVGCFSLYATKNVSTGEGGMITTDDDALADRLRLLRNQGMRARYQYEVPGHNYRMTNLAAAIGIPQLARLADINAARARHAALLREGLGDIEGLVVPAEPPAGRSHVYHQFTVRITADAPIGRDEFVDTVIGKGVGCGIYYPRVVFDYDCYRHHPGVVTADVPNARAAAAEVASLPVHPHLTSGEIDRIVATVREVMGA